MAAKINVTVKTVPHPEPQRLTEVIARLIVDGLLKQEQMHSQD